jgi:hypothetical protein
MGKRYEVLSKRFVHGKKGEVITLELDELQELVLLQTNAIKLAEDKPSDGTSETEEGFTHG